MYKRQDVGVRVEDNQSRDTTTVTATLKFHGAIELSHHVLAEQKFATLYDMEEDTRAMVHTAVYGEVAEDLKALFRLGREAQIAARSYGATRWHHSDAAGVVQEAQRAEKAFTAAFDALLNKLEKHP